MYPTFNLLVYPRKTTHCAALMWFHWDVWLQCSSVKHLTGSNKREEEDKWTSALLHLRQRQTHSLWVDVSLWLYAAFGSNTSLCSNWELKTKRVQSGRSPLCRQLHVSAHCITLWICPRLQISPPATIGGTTFTATWVVVVSACGVLEGGGNDERMGAAAVTFVLQSLRDLVSFQTSSQWNTLNPLSALINPGNVSRTGNTALTAL